MHPPSLGIITYSNPKSAMMLTTYMLYLLYIINYVHFSHSLLPSLTHSLLPPSLPHSLPPSLTPLSPSLPPSLPPSHSPFLLPSLRRGPSSAAVSTSAIPEDGELPGSTTDRWLKFNDTLVEEFDLNDSTLEAECFGGSLKNSNSESCEHIQYMT